jgi:hypothetical protein
MKIKQLEWVKNKNDWAVSGINEWIYRLTWNDVCCKCDIRKYILTIEHEHNGIIDPLKLYEETDFNTILMKAQQHFERGVTREYLED